MYCILIVFRTGSTSISSPSTHKISSSKHVSLSPFGSNANSSGGKVPPTPQPWGSHKASPSTNSITSTPVSAAVEGSHRQLSE
jgi:hypothetical protein